MARPSASKCSFIVPTDLLDDIASRFILDAPDSELGDPIPLCFLMELAYWFYLDEYVEEDDSLNNIKFDPFAQQLLNRVGIKPKTGTIEEMLQDFRDFKLRVPTYGGLLLSQDQSHVLLVQGFWHRASWGFPKGKINVDEEPHNCAIREVLEETGFDISNMIDPNIYLEMSIGEQRVRLYIITGVPMNTEFIPRTRGEIKQLKWFHISQLPSHKNDRNFNNKTKGSTNMFYMVMPFVKPLREWIANGTKGREGQRRHRSGTSVSDQSSHRQSRQNHSPVALGDSLKKQPNLSDSGRHIQSMVFSSVAKEQHALADNSARRRDTSKSKTRKTLFSESQDDDQKFTFKNRKGRNQSSHKQNRDNQPPHGSADESKKPFRSHSWQNFHINEKEIIEAVERAWFGVTLSWK
ncbi:mRNA-decapping enzyme subunit 2 [Halocaridina rubra]|uniref:mRNA-decapping enzyme 2 n=1 Tax=Halocaridina rubra TaxID=373956 RepID=A0AAN8X180_HALRR